jgi:hypothetical protein
MRSLPLTLLLATLLGCSSAPAGPSSPSGPDDFDLDLGRSCSGHGKADDLVAALPDWIKEMVILWPRVGRRSDEHGCATVARLTTINHQGVLMTLSFVRYDEGKAPQPRDYRVLNEPVPRAVLELQPDGARPWLLVEMTGAPSTSRDSLEQTLEFVPMETIVEALVGE